MKERGDLINPITAPFDGLDLIIESFNKAAGNAVIEVVENVVPVTLQRFDEFIIARNWAQPDLVTPREDSLFCPRMAVRTIENGG